MSFNTIDPNTLFQSRPSQSIPPSISYDSLRIPTGNLAQTPAPQRIEHITDNLAQRFMGVIDVQKDPKHTLEDYFVDYDHWEHYDESKSYSKRPYPAAYTGVMKTYRDYLFVLREGPDEEYFVVANRYLTELDKLVPYCTCLTCRASPLNPIKYLWCPHCTRCLKGGAAFAHPEYIERAKLLMQQAQTRKVQHSRWTKYRNRIDVLRFIESSAIIVVLILLLFMWY